MSRANNLMSHPAAANCKHMSDVVEVHCEHIVHRVMRVCHV